MLTQQLAASRSEDDGRISDMSFHDETLNNEDLSKIIFHNVQFSKWQRIYVSFWTEPV